MKQQSGFTLIELVIVIIILGILSATAIPKFINLQGDARAAAMQGVKGALEGASTIVYSKAAIQGVETTSSVNANSSDSGVELVYGYPAGNQTALQEAAGLSDDDWDFTGTGTVIITANDAGTDAQNSTTGCNVQYTEATSSARPTITVEADGC